MITTVYLSSNHVSLLARLAGRRPFPWSPLLEHVGEPEPTDDDIERLASRALIVDDGTGPRVNSAFAGALAAVAEPEHLVEIRFPGTPTVSICRTGPMAVGWHAFAPEQVAMSFPLSVPARYRLLTDLFGADGAPDPSRGVRLELTAAELDARAFDPPLRYAFAVRKVVFADPAEPPAIQALHVYRSGGRLVTTRPLGPDPDDPIEVQDLNLRQLVDVIFTLTVDPQALVTG